MSEATVLFSLTLPTDAVPRVVALVDDLKAQGYEVGAVLTRDDETHICPLCGQRLAQDGHLHG